MRMVNNELEIYRGESFTLDFTVVNYDDTPYIVDKHWENPHLLITVASTKSNLPTQYVYNRWLSLEELPRFGSSVPLRAKNLAAITGAATLPVHDVNDVAYVEDGNNILGVFYAYDDDGNKIFRYYSTVTNQFEDYEFRVQTLFAPEDSAEWKEKNYTYSIRLVTGDINPKWNDSSPVTDNGEAPIVDFNQVIIVLEPTNMTVLQQNGELS